MDIPRPSHLAYLRGGHQCGYNYLVFPLIIRIKTLRSLNENNDRTDSKWGRN